MEALGALAVAERDIRALRTARLRLRRALSRPVAPRTARIVARSGDFARSARRDPASPFQSARGDFCGVSYRTFHVETACATYVSLVD